MNNIYAINALFLNIIYATEGKVKSLYTQR